MQDAARSLIVHRDFLHQPTVSCQSVGVEAEGRFLKAIAYNEALKASPTAILLVVGSAKTNGKSLMNLVSREHGRNPEGAETPRPIASFCREILRSPRTSVRL
jgi:hypothetical protein